MTVIATSGHVDHGKSTLVQALTGTDPDRLAEEKARGLTIDLGFAGMTLPNGQKLSFIDVPGHVRFLRNMLAGVGGVEATMFVVSAVEGWKPQSEEHLRILDLLGIERGVVALTMADLVDEELLELAQLDVAEHVEGTFLEGAPIVGVGAPTGLGIADLTLALSELVQQMGRAVDRGKPRLWVDRAFAAAGAGTVVTGTLVGGSLAAGEELNAGERRQPVRIRALQTHNKEMAKVRPGNRVALNLTGIAHTDIGRGDVLVRADTWHYTSMIDAELHVLASLDHDVTRRGAYAAYIGSGEFSIKLRVLGDGRLRPGSTGAVRMYLDRSLPAGVGDRFVLREHGRDETVGGGHFLDIDPLVTASKAQPDSDPLRMVAERGWVTVDYLEMISGQRLEANVGTWVVSAELLAQTRDALRMALDEAGPVGFDVAGLDQRQRAVLDTMEDVKIINGLATLGEVVDPYANHPFIAELNASPFRPPTAGDHNRNEIRELVRRKLIVETEGIFFSAKAVQDAATDIATLLANQPNGFTVSDARDIFDTSRKYVLPLLNYMDRNGITRRRDDLRIAGPRL